MQIIKHGLLPAEKVAEQDMTSKVTGIQWGPAEHATDCLPGREFVPPLIPIRPCLAIPHLARLIAVWIRVQIPDHDASW